jgi:hypothetical protein
MRNVTHPLRRLGLVTGLMIVSAVLSGSATGQSTGTTQASGPCALLTIDDIQPLAPNTKIADGLAMSFDVGYTTCRYSWGTGPNHYTLDVSAGEASRMFSGVQPDLVKPALQAMVAVGTADAVITDVGEAAIFKADSQVYVYATAYLKSRILQVRLDGSDARDKKDQVIGLLKTAATRF